MTVMRESGFKKQSSAWYRRTADAVLVMNLQKSDFGEQYYVNLGVWLITLGDVPFPKANHCHVQMRAVALCRDQQDFLEMEVFNLDRSMEPLERVELIRSFLKSMAIPFLNECGSIEGLRRLYRDGRLNSAGVMVVARRFLES
jgi:hypothetical protein